MDQNFKKLLYLLEMFNCLILLQIAWQIRLTEGRSNVNAAFHYKSNIEKLAPKLAETIKEVFHDETGFEFLEKEFQKNYNGKLITKKLDIQAQANKAKEDLTKYFADRIKAVRKLVEEGETIASKIDANVYPTDCVHFIDLTNNPENRTLTDEELLNRSGIHQPVDVFLDYDGIPYEGCQPFEATQRAIRWSESLDDTFREIASNTDGIWRQYVGFSNGLTRIFPAKQWIDDPLGYSVDLFDPRARMWYTTAISDPKDVLLLLDFSGSVHGQTLRMMKQSILMILTTLGSNDYINALWYNNEVGYIVPCFPGFIRATSRNKLFIVRKIAEVKETNMANLDKAMRFAFEEFKKLDNESVPATERRSSGGSRMIMLFSDGTESYASEVIDEFAPLGEDNKRNVSIRIFTFPIGDQVQESRPLKWLACVNKGYYAMIDSLGDLRYHTRDYVPILSRPLALTNVNIPVAKREVTWNGPYMDAQGEGPIITVSMPILDTMINGSNRSFLGVAAIDMRIEDIRRIVEPEAFSTDSYAFMLDNNAKFLFHPKCEFPLTDLYLIGRSACADIAKKDILPKQYINQDTKYGTATETIYRQNGVLDSIPSIEMFDLEKESEEKSKLLKRMLFQKCDDNTVFTTDNVFLTGKTTTEVKNLNYICRTIANTPFSFAIAYPNESSSKIFGSKSSDENLEDLVDYTVTDFWPGDRNICGENFTRVNFVSRFDELLTRWRDGSCETAANDATLALRLDIDAIMKWKNSFLLPKYNLNL